MAGQMTVGDRSVTAVFLDDERINAIYYGHTLIYIYVGYTLIDADEKILVDSDGNNLTCA
jgi:hypothetical protein